MRQVFIWLALLVGTETFAQGNKQTVWGYLRDSVTGQPIVLASVTNLNKAKTVMTSTVGLFRIDLSPNDILSFAAVGYHFDTVHFAGVLLLNDTLALRLAPLTYSLGNVTVTAKGMSRYQLDSIERRMEFLQDIVNYTIPTVSQANSGAGIALNLDRFSKHEKRKRKAFAFFEANEKEEYINYRFPPELVTRYSSLKEEELQQFMQQYRPTEGWLRKNKTDEDIKYYINEKLKLFFKR